MLCYVTAISPFVQTSHSGLKAILSVPGLPPGRVCRMIGGRRFSKWLGSSYLQLGLQHCGGTKRHFRATVTVESMRFRSPFFKNFAKRGPAGTGGCWVIAISLDHLVALPIRFPFP